MDRAILQKWLKSGYMEKHVLHETTDGTPQGGIVSPALANCALDRLEQLLKENYPAGRRVKSLGGLTSSVNFIRYADDFVITSKSKDLLKGEVQPLVEQFLQQRGLKLSPTLMQVDLTLAKLQCLPSRAKGHDLHVECT